MKIYIASLSGPGFGDRFYNQGIIKYKPDIVEFVTSIDDADYIFTMLCLYEPNPLEVLLESTSPELHDMVKSKPKIYWIECTSIPLEYSRLKLDVDDVIISHDPILAEFINKYRDILLSPMWVVDGFTKTNYGQRQYDVISSNNVDYEFGLEVNKAVSAINGRHCILRNGMGNDCSPINTLDEWNFQCSDLLCGLHPINELDEIVRLCNNSRCSPGLNNYVRGWETLAMEGAFCGCTPIFVDMDIYRYWHNDYAEFIPLSNNTNIPSEINRDEVVEGLVSILSSELHSVDTALLKEKYCASVVVPEVWEYILSQ